MKLRLFLLTLLAAALSACRAGPTPGSPPATLNPVVEKGAATMTFQLISGAFSPGQPIPAKYSCDGQDISPPLEWRDPPAGTRSFALIMDDPDAPAGVWDHWLLFNLPADTRILPEQATPPAGARPGRNSWGRTSYGGPCPPRGVHRYFFKLYALATPLELAAGATKKDLLRAMERHILAQAELMGTYARK
ncbi:MAG: YbhB/YbcL family Raf kinase inhibitor-like protein [Chloroflexota bacterium]